MENQPFYSEEAQSSSNQGNLIEDMNNNTESVTNGSQNSQSENLFKQQREKLWKIVSLLRTSTDIDSLFKSSVIALREELQASRVLIYRFDSQDRGEVVMESLVTGWTPTRGETLPGSMFGALSAADYQSQEIVSLSDIYQTGLSPYQLQLLEKYQVKASLALPILLNADILQADSYSFERVWGLLVVQQCDNVRQWSDAEINLLYQISTELTMALQPTQLRGQIEQQLEQERVVGKVVQKIQRTNDLKGVFQTATQEIRSLIQADRVVVYRFNPDWSGEIMAEAMTAGWTSVMEIQKTDQRLYTSEMTNYNTCTLNKLQATSVLDPDTYLKDTQGGSFTQGNRFKAVNDVYQAGFSACYLESLEKYQARAYLIVPIFQDDQLWGLLAAYQNSGAREWQAGEINLMLKLSTPLGLAIKQAEFVAQLQVQTQQLSQVNQQDKTLAKIVDRIRSSLDLNNIFRTATREVRQLLKCDRVIVYRFNRDWSGEVMAESADSQWVSVMEIQRSDTNLYTSEMSSDDSCTLTSLEASSVLDSDTYLRETQGGIFTNGANYRTVSDVYQAGFSACYLESLEKYQARAYVIVPIFQQKQLWGLLAAYQNSDARQWQPEEVDLMLKVSTPLGVAIQQAEAVKQVQAQSKAIEQAAVQERALSGIFDRIRRSLDLADIFRTTTQEVRRLLKADRAVVYRFNRDWSGQVLAESVEKGWISVLEIQQDDPTLYTSEMSTFEKCTLKTLKSEGALDSDTYLRETQGGVYTKGESYRAVNDIYQAGFSRCYIESLEKYQAKAYIIAPIFQDEKLWGLLGVYQNSGAREWQPLDISLMQKVAPQLGIAIKQAEFVQQLQQQSAKMEQKAKRERGLARMAERMQLARDSETIFSVACQEARRILDLDRVAVYQFNDNWGGTFVGESAASGWSRLMNIIPVLKDTYLEETQGGRYVNNESLIVNDIYTSGFEACHIELLEQMEARAYVIVPIFANQKLWGLLGAYHNSAPHQWEAEEESALRQVAIQVGGALQLFEYLIQVRTQSESLAKAAERETNFIRLLAKINQKIIEQSQLQLGIESLFRTSTQEIRRLLKVDRVAILSFKEDWTGEFISEDVAKGYVNLVGTEIALMKDPDVQDTKGRYYRNGESLVAKDIYTSEISNYLLEFSEQLAAKAFVITPIFKADQLWGLLATYQNEQAREWEAGEISLLSQASVQLGVAIQQTEYLEQVEAQSRQLEITVERERNAKEELQQRAIDVLTAVKPAFTGDLTVRAPLTEDEVGTIAGAYNSTLDALREIVEQVQTAAREVTQTTGESNAAIEGLATQAQQQFQELSQALGKIQEMVNSTEATTRNAQQVGVAVQQANQTLQAGDTAMNKTVDSIVAIRKTVSETGKRVKRLSESSQKISKVVNLISNFADQTNLLALNAALEATRAGEYGKGFAVVADEVRSLAHQSAQATTEIEKLVQEIQDETQQVAGAMTTGIKQVAEGTNLVNETRQNLNEIVAATAQISQLVEGITHATRVQTQQAEAVTEVMNQVATIANETSEDSLEISASFQELLAMANELQASVGQFKVQ